MAKIKISRVIPSGFLAGIAYLFLETLAEGLLSLILGVSQGRFYSDILQVSPRGWRAQTVNIAIFFAQCILMIWLYAALRPRFRSHPRAVLAVCLVFWLFEMCFGAILLNLGLLPPTPVLISLGYDLILGPFVVFLGGAIYHRLGDVPRRDILAPSE